MPVYSYQALTGEQKAVKGTIACESARQARNSLRKKGFCILALNEVGLSERDGGEFYRIGTLSPGKIATFTGELSTLLAVGVPLLDAMETLTRQYRGRFRTRLMAIRDDMDESLWLHGNRVAACGLRGHD